ncbi:hypothetical protein pEaSNUABM9_00026 [Erwinia phage pEa_SNUABM_9]|nr:hypothetical protein pEaSNUABM9_00026 [Erwinia phage pEa_SNUABM_9]
MTSMTMVGGLVAPAPQWRLGELGELLKEHMTTKIESLDQLTLYMQRNDADMLYGGRMLAQIDAILDDLRRNGISRDLAVAVESARPGTIPKNVQSLLTSNYTRTHQKETIAALESWKEAGKLGLVVLVITAVLKMLGWILANGSGYSPDASGKDFADRVEYVDKVKASIDTRIEKVQENVRPEAKATAQVCQCASVQDAYTDALSKGKVQQGGAKQAAVAAVKLDKVIAKVKGQGWVDYASLRAGKSVFAGIFDDIVAGKGNANDVIEMAINRMLRDYHVGDAVFTQRGGGLVYASLPERLRKAGIRVPVDTVFTIANNRFGELAAYFNSVAKGFDDLRQVDLSKENPDLHAVRTSFAAAIRTLNDTLATSIPDVSKKGMALDTMPAAAMNEQQASTLIGYGDPVGFINDKVIVAAGYESYLNGTSFGLISDQLKPNDGELEVILSAVCLMLNKDNISTNTNVSNMSGYKKLEADVELLVSKIETWQKDMQRNKNIDLNKLGRDLAAASLEQRSDSLNLGREISMEYQDTPDFFATLRKQMSYVRQICRGVLGMNRVITTSSKNVILKSK